MNIYITIEIKETDSVFEKITNVEKLNEGIISKNEKFNPYISNDLNNLDLLTEELKGKRTDVLVGYACYNLEQILYLSNKLKENNQRLHTVFIPSPERLLKRKGEELDFTNKHGNFASFSPSQIEEGYQEWQRIYEEIKRELPKHSIEVKEV
ncbi:MAG: hypothetical protein MUF58_14650 [Arcicella sp.]|jgi:hypothetical protein|nr:hypothetical protein [Arcicella sp.]